MSKKPEKQVVMYMTDHNPMTGFGGQADNICRILGDKYDVYFVGWGFHHATPIVRTNYTLLPCAQHPFGADVFGGYINQYKPELVIVQADTRMVDWIPNTLKQSPHKPTWVFYPVVDGFVWDKDNKCTKWAGNWRAVKAEADKIVAMTKFGQKVLKANGLSSEVIYHGLDTTLFRPYTKEQKEQAKIAFGVKGKFVVGGIFKNIQRKHPEKYLQAFCVFRKGKEDKVALMVLTSPSRQFGGELELIQHCADYGLIIGKDVFFTKQGLPTRAMPTLINAMDVGWILGTMEGFGIPTIEFMSCGIPLVGTNTCTFPEIVGKTALISDIPVYPKSGGMPISFGSYNGIECPVPNPYDIASKTNKLYSDKSLREDLSFKSTKRAIEKFDWNIIGKKWVKLVKESIITAEDLPEEWRKIYDSVK